MSLPSVFNTWDRMPEVVVVINGMAVVKMTVEGLGEVKFVEWDLCPLVHVLRAFLQPSVTNAPPVPIIFIT